jgi:hypothetical protein
VTFCAQLRECYDEMMSLSSLLKTNEDQGCKASSLTGGGRWGAAPTLITNLTNFPSNFELMSYHRLSMAKKAALPDAWDDDWESQADKLEDVAPSPTLAADEPVKVTKAERLAKHAETNKKLWDSAYGQSLSQ